MKNSIAIVFVFLISWPLLVKIMVVVSWQANRDYIAKNLCEKRDIPDSDCDGACHLVKQLDKTEDKNTPSPTSGLEKIELLPFELVENSVLKNHFTYISVLREKHPNLYSFKYPVSFFHPPSPKV